MILLRATLVLAAVPGLRWTRGEAAVQQPTAGDRASAQAFSQEELDQMLAPIALYPDDLLSQVLMAATYPIEVVQADRWAKAQKDLQGDAAARALEAEDWDPSVKSLVNFPPVLEMLSTELDWTQKLGDAFLGQQEQVMETVQKLRGKAVENDSLESDEQQTVTVEGAVIQIESASPDVIYVPTYDPVVVYGSWWYPAYPPYPYHPPGYTGAAFVFGVAWGYAWGHCDWHGGDIDIDIDRNIERNRNIDRDKYVRNNRGESKGTWRHDASHRGSVPYRNEAAARQFGGVSTAGAARARDAYRGRAEAGRTGLGPTTSPGGLGAADRSSSLAGSRDALSGRGGVSGGSASRLSSSGRSSAFSGVGSGGSAARAQSARGRVSRGGRGGRR